MAKALRMDLIEEYYSKYRARNLSRGGFMFRQRYTEISELWLNLTDEERKAVNIRFIQENLETQWEIIL